MGKYSRDKRKKHQKASVRDFYSQPVSNELPGSNAVHDGFLFKGDTPVSIVTTGLIQTAAEGFLHVDETEKYEP